MRRFPKWGGREADRKVSAALDGVEFLTAHDLMDLLGEDSSAATPEDLAVARSLLEVHGYRERKFAFFGRAGFRRFEKVAYDPGRPRLQVPVFGSREDGRQQHGDA